MCTWLRHVLFSKPHSVKSVPTPPKAVTKVSDSTKSGTYEAVRWERCRVKYLVSEVDVSGCRRRFERLLDVRNRLLQAYSRI
jgi:hypothetical protein